MATKAQQKASAKYDKVHTKQIVLKLNLVTDNDILYWLDQQSNKQGEIKRLIREEIRRRK